MPNATPVIHLDIRNSTQTDPAWKNIKVNNSPYAYRYTGGDDSLGGMVVKKGQGRDAAPFQLDAAGQYKISGCAFMGDTQNQLSWRGNSDRAGTITDEASQVESAEYTITVVDTGNGNCVIPCDPPIRNDP